MRRLRRLPSKLLNLFRHGRAERDLSREIRSHLTLLEDEFQSKGMSLNDARLAARRAYGGVEQTKELHRDERSIRWLDQTLQDIRHSWRSLRKSPAFSVVAILTLTLGIGANAAIFSIINVALFHPLPYRDSPRLVGLSATNLGAGITVVSVPKLSMVEEQTRSLASVGAYFAYFGALTTTGSPEQLLTARVSSRFFETLGIKPALGREFMPDENREGGRDVALISDSFWQSHFAGDPAAIGRAIPMDGRSTIVIGVLPANFRFPFLNPEPSIWLPRVFDNPQYTPELIRQGASYLLLMGRLKEGQTVQQAQKEIDVITGRYRKENPGTADSQAGLSVDTLERVLLGNLRTSLIALSGAVGFVLLIACANVANLLLARATTREKEIAVRRALGASRGRLIRQLLTESVLLSFLGGAIGILLAWLCVPPLMAAIAPGTIPLSGEIRVDGTVLLFTAAICCVTALVFGLLPALQISRRELHGSLKDGVRGSTGGGHGGQMRRCMVVSEVALAVVLTTGAGLLIQSLMKLIRVNPGFVSSGVVTFPFSLPGNRYATAAQQGEFYRQFLERVQVLAGVESASLVSFLPLSGNGARFLFFCAEGTACKGLGKDPITAWSEISPDYFSTMKIRLLRGRPFDGSDAAASRRVVIINETIAKTYYAGTNPIGRHLANSRTMIPMEIVGVVEDTKFSALNAPNAEQIYVPYTQDKWNAMNLVVRSSSDPRPLMTAVRKAVASLDSELPLAGIQPMDQVVSGSVAQPRLIASLAGSFAASALLLAAIGIYGVMAYLVTQRSLEMAIRLALGARRASVFQLVVGQGMRLVTIGVITGVLASLALTRLLSTLLFHMDPVDMGTLAGVSGLFAAIALGACYLPARRAMRLDPQAALRSQ